MCVSQGLSVCISECLCVSWYQEGVCVCVSECLCVSMSVGVSVGIRVTVNEGVSVCVHQ